MKLLFFTILIFAISTVPSYSQLENYLGQINKLDVENYAKPLATSLGVVMNSGSYHTAKVSKIFGFSFGFRGMLVFVPESDKTFTPVSLDKSKGYDNSLSTASVYGDKGTAYAGQDGFIAYPGGFNINTIGLAVPQASVSFMGTEALIRYVGGFKIGDKSINLFGIGGKHNVSQYFPLFPVDIAVHVLYNTFTISDVTNSNNLAFGAHASKSFGLLTAYGGLQFESTTVKFEYKNASLKDKIEVEVKGKNSFRFTVGGALHFGFLVFNADYSVGSQNVLTSGLTFEF